MTDIFGFRQLNISWEQLEDLQFVEMSPIAREILQKSKLKAVSDLANPDPTKAAEAGRALAQWYFQVE